MNAAARASWGRHEPFDSELRPPLRDEWRSRSARPSLLSLCSLALLAACTSARPASRPEAPLPSPHPGSAFVVRGLLEAPPRAALIGGDAGIVVEERPVDSLGLRVLRSEEDVAAGGFALAAPVDFARWIVIAPRAAVVRLQPKAWGSRWLEPGDQVLEVRIGNPCANICGGAATTQLYLEQCQREHEADAYLVPRPVAELRVVRVYERGCDPRLP